MTGETNMQKRLMTLLEETKPIEKDLKDLESRMFELRKKRNEG